LNLFIKSPKDNDINPMRKQYYLCGYYLCYLFVGANKESYDLIILDIRIPELNGFVLY